MSELTVRPVSTTLFMTRHRQTTTATLHDDEGSRLKSAIRRAWAGETAPPPLRSRVERALAAEGLLDQEAGGVAEQPVLRRTSPSFWRRPFAYGVAAATAVAVVGGAVAVQTARQTESAGQVAQAPAAIAAAPTDVVAASLPTELGEQLVRSHNACIRYHTPDHHLFEKAPKDNYKLIAEGLSAELKHPVLAAPMGVDWDFQGAGICPVGKRKCGHLKYASGDAVVSIYSLPASANPACPPNQTCEDTVKGKPLAGFAEGGAFYCVVASTGGKTPIDFAQVRAIRDRLRSDVVAAAAGRDSTVAMSIH